MVGGRRFTRWLGTALALPALLGCALALPANAQGQSPAVPAPPPVAFGAEVAGDGKATRLTFTLSAHVDGTVAVLDRPDRIVVDLPEVNFQLPVEDGRRSRGLVKSVRYGLVAAGRSRVVIELAAPALPGPISHETILGGAAVNLSLEVKRADREQFAKVAAAHRKEQVAAAAPAPAADGDSRPVVVLDPGHGGIDTGAIGLNDTIEKDVVLSFANTLKAKLEATGAVRVVLTRSGDAFVSLTDRVEIARAQGAALFVSIHADTLTHTPEVRGLTVYTNSERPSDAEAARLAEAENQADALAGVESPQETEEVAGILGDLTLRETRTYSHLFAKTLVGRMAEAAKLNKNPHRSARFLVLRAPDVPSVLVELGYLSSKTDVDLLRQDAWRERAAETVSEAVTAFLAPRLAAKAETPQN
jgi:N-acetylmuramoyl-L-alanine amidase